ncbi:MAG: hypothetical protein ACLFNQ_07000 [Spirochaetaceae bacterium]
MSELLPAQLSRLLYPNAAGTEDRTITLFGGGSRRQTRSSIERSGLFLHPTEPSGAALIVDAIVPGASLSVTPRALGLPESWKGALNLIFDVEVPNDREPLALSCGVACVRSRISEVCELDSGVRTRVGVGVFELPLATGLAEPDRPEAIELVLQWNGGATSRRLRIHSVMLEIAGAEDTSNRGAAVEPCVDRYGQRRFASWSGKVTNDADLHAARDEDAAQQLVYGADATSCPLSLFPGRNKYGGFADVEGFEASGFFRVEQDEAGVWWFVDPLGQPFWSQGVTGVRTNRGTPVVGREHLYQELPERTGRYRHAYVDLQDGFHQPVLSFYRWNALRTHGTLDAWADATIDRLASWGINTLGNWSEEIVNRRQRIPSVASIRSVGEHTPRIGRFPDVFEPSWSETLEQRIREQARENRNNPWLLGYFVDNELPWGRMNLLDAPKDAAVRKEWVNVVRDLMGDLAGVNGHWHTSFERWEDVASMETNELAGVGPTGDEARSELEKRFAEKYFLDVSTLIAKHDPNHLYLGCRFVRKLPPRYVVEAAGRSAALLTVNCYALFPERELFHTWHDWSGGRPILIGEHHLSRLCERGFPPLFPAFTAVEREQYYALYVQQWASQPWSIGCHWFQYSDQALTGRDRDGENQIIGLVDITDRPYPEMERAVLAQAMSLYEAHMKATRHTLPA